MSLTRTALKVELPIQLMQLLSNLPSIQTKNTNPITDWGNPPRQKNFFIIPHGFEEKSGQLFNPYEKYFYITLCRLQNRLANSNGWFWHTDSQFREYGFTRTRLYQMRKKFEEAGLLKIRKVKIKRSIHTGIEYHVITDF